MNSCNLLICSCHCRLSEEGDSCSKISSLLYAENWMNGAELVVMSKKLMNEMEDENMLFLENIDVPSG